MFAVLFLMDKIPNNQFSCFRDDLNIFLITFTKKISSRIVKNI
jgi:hypothetical protein